jgi:hypothetical protein
VTLAHELPPLLRVKDDGSHVAVCRACQTESPVAVSHGSDPQARFALRAHIDEHGDVVVDEWTHGERAVFDFSEHERHVREDH